MGYRFYTQQLEATGNCPGAPLTNRRKRKMAWTDESRQQAIEAYEAAGDIRSNLNGGASKLGHVTETD